jgi:hypothetical protein
MVCVFAALVMIALRFFVTQPSMAIGIAGPPT